MIFSELSVNVFIVISSARTGSIFRLSYPTQPSCSGLTSARQKYQAELCPL